VNLDPWLFEQFVGVGEVAVEAAAPAANPVVTGVALAAFVVETLRVFGARRMGYHGRACFGSIFFSSLRILA